MELAGVALDSGFYGLLGAHVAKKSGIAVLGWEDTVLQ
jgi:hypothetical protein